eukprot:RCo013257
MCVQLCLRETHLPSPSLPSPDPHHRAPSNLLLSHLNAGIPLFHNQSNSTMLAEFGDSSTFDPRFSDLLDLLLKDCSLLKDSKRLSWCYHSGLQLQTITSQGLRLPPTSPHLRAWASCLSDPLLFTPTLVSQLLAFVYLPMR